MIAGGFVNRRETGGRFQEALCFSEGLSTQTRSRLKATSACLLCGWFRSRSLVLEHGSPALSFLSHLFIGLYSLIGRLSVYNRISVTLIRL